jgi:hypothetical protein
MAGRAIFRALVRDSIAVNELKGGVHVVSRPFQQYRNVLGRISIVIDSLIAAAGAFERLPRSRKNLAP